MHGVLHDWPELFGIAGSVFGVAGTFLMANRHLNIRFYKIPSHMIYAFTNTRRADVEEQISEWTRENSLQSIRGLALIALGFLLQVVPSVWKLVT